MAASLINERIHSEARVQPLAGSSRRVSLNQSEHSQVSFSEAMNVLFAGAKETKGSSSVLPTFAKAQDNSAEPFDLAASLNLKVREFAALEPDTKWNDFELLEQNPASGSDFSVLDALSDGLMFASKIAGAVLSLKPF